MTPNEKIIMDEAKRKGLRYSSESRLSTAMKQARADLIKAKDYQNRPLDGRPTKMEALDFLRLVSMVLPQKINDGVVHDCKIQFSACNECSKMEIAMIFALSNHTDAIPFLENVVRSIADPDDWVRKTAHEAIQVLWGHLNIGFGSSEGRWIYRTIKPLE